MKTIEADKILLNYAKPYLTMREILNSIPKDKLGEMRASYKDALEDKEIVGDNLCPHCKHLHNNGLMTLHRIRLFLERIDQVLNGDWATKNGR